jgi:hypothetical protein
MLIISEPWPVLAPVEWVLITSFIPTTEFGVETVSHFIMPGSADTADGAAILTGITKEATINIAAKTPSMLGNLVFIIPPDFLKTRKTFSWPVSRPGLAFLETPGKNFRPPCTGVF